MSIQEKIEIPSTSSAGQDLIRLGAAGFEDFAKSLEPLEAAIDSIDGLGELAAIKAAAKIRRELQRFEPSVTMIGQIKSGKTTLVNAMIGQPELLPADVNPWTSVVTSLHLCPRALTPPTRATFQFFDNDEWDRLVKGGGRVGELAERAGAEHELSKIISQAEAMREKARARLGRKFELLLGSTQTYGYFDKELVARYVCLGDQSEAPVARSQGTFADITRSADLYMQQAALPINLCIRDTPGVNDTFMVREQITIKALRDSRICVVVLSAHQALSSSDLAMIRLISNVKTREVIIFVNRIDELGDPGRDVPAIRESIEATLEKHNGPRNAQIIFGSALWAQMAAQRRLKELPKASLEALFNWAEASPVPHDKDSDPNALLWLLSGLPALYDAIAVRIAEGEGQDMLTRCSAQAANLLGTIRAADNLAAKKGLGNVQLQMSFTEFDAKLQSIQTSASEMLEVALNEHIAAFHQRVDRAHESFIARATEDLAKHLEFFGEGSLWTYDPAGLRVLLLSGYKSFVVKVHGAFAKTIAHIKSELQLLANEAINLDPKLYDPRVPQAPFTPPPVSIGQTIALDLRGSWWKAWWNRRQDYMTQATRFQGLVRAETKALIHDLKVEQAGLVRSAMQAELSAFLTEQIANLQAINTDEKGGHIDKILDLEELKQRDRTIAAALSKLEEAQYV